MFILDRPNSDKLTYIFVKKKLSDDEFKQSLGVKIHPDYWIKESERAQVVGLDKLVVLENKSINALLSDIENFITTRIQEARYNPVNQLTCSELADYIYKRTGKKPRKGAGMYDKCRLIIDDMKTGILLTDKGKRYSVGTIKNYKQSLASIETYDPDLAFRDIDMDFYRAFIKWCNDKDWSMNYIAQHIKNLCMLMKEGKKRKYHNNTAHLDEDFKVIQEETDDISLEQHELDKIYNKIINNKIDDIARDWFIIGCYSGLRVSDVKALSPVNIASDSILIANEKTDIKVMIPMRPEVKAIVQKWSGLPPKLSDMEINRSMKATCRELQINETFLYSVTKGGRRQDYYLQKWEMVSPHTMRRCFITNLLEAGFPDNQVMALAGIKKHATLLRYKKTKVEKTAKIVKEHHYFTGSNSKSLPGSQ